MLGELVPLALVVALSPVSIIPAVVLVLHTARPRPTGLAFMAGWLAGLAVLTIVFVQLPHRVDGLGRESPTWAPWVRIAVGVLLVALAVGRWVTRKRQTRPPAFLNRLSRIKPVGAGVIGFGLVVANPKVVVINAAAGLIIGTAAVGVGVWLAVAFYTALAGSTVIAPILAYLVAGERVEQRLEQGRAWMQREHATVTAAVLLIVGVLLAYTGIRAL
ncbi:GAP family protein [Mycolicibacterium stellerae]|uniref:GAP family protein n=1 Tax=Mycolicibacterium stellerae TaxID=2358193 RepID=UPI000F0B668C|nr:GAP family protein [Mycolicibacterium stellerae]